MSIEEELKILASRHRWAWEELCYDFLCKETNVVLNGGSGTMFCWLRARLGSSEAVMERLQQESEEWPRSLQSWKSQYVWLVHNYGGVIEELIERLQDDRAIVMFGTVQSMYRYLKEKLESNDRIHEALIHMCQDLSTRHKTIPLVRV